MLKRFLTLVTLVVLALSVSSVCRAQWPYVPVAVQSESNSLNATSIPCVFDGNVTSGNYVLVAFSWVGTNNTPTVSDTLISTYAQKIFNTTNTEKVGFYTTTLGSSGANTVTVAVAAASFMNVVCVEVPPLWNLTTDASSVSTFAGSPGTVTTPSITTTLNSDLVFAYIGNDNTFGGQGLQAASLGTWYQVGSSGGADSQSAFMRVGGVSGAGNNVTVDNLGTSGTTLSIAFQSKPLAVTSAAQAPDGGITTAYDWTALAAGGIGTYTWSIASGALPTGLSINPGTGRITGTPTVSNNYTATIQVTDGSTTASKAISFKIATSLNAITLTQSKVCSVSTGCSSLTFVSNVTAGHAIVLNINYNAGNAQFDYCTDSLGTPYTVIGATQYGAITQALRGAILTVAGIAPSTGADTILCPSFLNNGFMIAAVEFANIQFLSSDNVGYTRGINASPATITSSALTPLVPNELLFGVCSSYNSAGTDTVSAPFTQVGGIAFPSMTGYQIATTVTTYTMSCNQASNPSGAWMFSIVALRPSSGTVVPPSGGTAKRKHPPQIIRWTPRPRARGRRIVTHA